VGRAHLARAALEGVAFRAREILDHIYAVTDFPPPAALGIDGGLSRGGQFLQILADLTGRPVRRHATPEATMLGAAQAAGRGASVLSEGDVDKMISFEPTVEPRLAPDQADARFAAWRQQVYGSPP
jgi:glycerol kinase